MNRLLGFKSNQLAEALRQKIVSGEYPQGSRLPTCRELASQYSVSYVTAHKAMAWLEKNGYITMREHCGTTVTYIQAAPRPTRKLVNLLTVDSELPAAQDFLELGKELFSQAGWEVRSFQMDDGDFLPDEALQAVNSPDAYSVFFELRSSFQNTLASLDHFYERSIYLGEYLTDQRLTCVTSDDPANVRSVLEHFRSLGRSRTAIFCYGMLNKGNNLRVSTWRGEMMAHGASFQWCTEHIFYCEPSYDYEKTEWIRDSFRQLLNSGRLAEIDSIFIPIERHAVLFEELCAENGIRIPEDIAIVTQGLDPCIHTANPPLSYIDNHLKYHLRMVLDILDARLKGEDIRQQFFTFYSPRLVVAQSSAVEMK